VFDKSWRGERLSYINRTDLEAKGRAFMTLAQFAEQVKIKKRWLNDPTAAS
jgi:hypothetical protein